VQILGNNREANRKLAAGLLTRINRIPGIVDLHVHQPMDQPKLHITVDRTRAADLGLTQRDVANNLLVSLSGSQQTAPTFWLNPTTGVSYFIREPRRRSTAWSRSATSRGFRFPATSRRSWARSRPSSAVRASPSCRTTTSSRRSTCSARCRGRDLGGVSRDLNRIIREVEPSLPRGTRLMVRGEIATMTVVHHGAASGVCCWPSCWSIC
jgi:Cu/Ag efflux pump CusA